MVEPRIQYTKTEDGVNIAYSTMGEGPPLVVVPSWISHLELDQQELVKPTFFKRLAAGSLLVRYDKRGMGLSTRNVRDYSLEAQVSDLHTIIEHLHLSGVTLFGSSQGGTICIAYAVQHPENVSRLILFGAYHHMPAAVKETLGAILPLVRTDWAGLGTSPMLEMFIPGASPQTRDFFVRYQMEAANGEDAAAILDALAAYEVTSILPEIRVPTLVLHRRDDSAVSVDQGHEIASLIPNAQFVPLDGRIHLPYWGDTEPLIAAIEEFLERPATSPARPGSLVTILFTDMEGSTTLAQQRGDIAAQEVRRAHNDIVRSALAANGGSEIKHTGDGIMASFSTASSALDCAIAIQQGVAAYKEEHPNSPLGVYVGLNAGEPIAEDDDLFGTSVDLAARLVDHAQPGQIIASDVVRQLAAGKDFLFADLGETELRGFEDPVKLWELRPMPQPTPDEVKQAIDQRYGVSAQQHLAWREAAADVLPAAGPESWAAGLYSDDELAFLPAGVASFAIGCGNPTSIAELQAGEAVLDMGSGNGVDCFLAARLVGSTGRVTGVDMNDDMLALASRNLELVDVNNVQFQRGDLASIPLPDASIDAVISNCVVNLTSDKRAALGEAFRVLKPGGRLRIADIVWTKTPSQDEQDQLASWTGCVAGAMEVDEYVPLLEQVGFERAALTLRQVAEPGYASAYVSADKPG